MGDVVDIRTGAPPEGPLAAFWDTEKGALDLDKATSAFIERDAVVAQHAERLKGIPDAPEKYALSFPETFKLPDGVEAKFDDQAYKPVVDEFRSFAHEMQLPQSGVSKLLALQAQSQAVFVQGAISEHQQMVAAEAAKMGGAEAAKARHAPINEFISRHLNDAEASELRLLMQTEVGTSLVERLLEKGRGGVMPSRAMKPAQQPPRAQTVAERWYGGTTPGKGR